MILIDVTFTEINCLCEILIVEVKHSSNCWDIVFRYLLTKIDQKKQNYLTKIQNEIVICLLLFFWWEHDCSEFRECSRIDQIRHVLNRVILVLIEFL